MNDVGVFLCTVNVNILHTKSFRKQHINLNGYNCIFLAENVLVLDIKFRTIERRLVNSDGIFNAEVVEYGFHC